MAGNSLCGQLKGAQHGREIVLEDFVNGAFDGFVTGNEPRDAVVWHNGPSTSLQVTPTIFPRAILHTVDVGGPMALYRGVVFSAGTSFGATADDGSPPLAAGGWYWRMLLGLEPAFRERFEATAKERENRARDLEDAVAERRAELKEAKRGRDGLPLWDPKTSPAKHPAVRAYEARRPYVGAFAWIERVEGAPLSKPRRDADREIHSAIAKREHEGELAQAIAAANGQMLERLAAMNTDALRAVLAEHAAKPEKSK